MDTIVKTAVTAASAHSDSWQPELDELHERQRWAREMGGPEKVKRQHEAGRMTVRERIERLVDAGSFREVGSVSGRGAYDAGGNLMHLSATTCVMGRADIDGRPVVVVGDDFTVRGGSADASIMEKPVLAERMACEMRLPIVRLVEGSGGGGSVKTIEQTGHSNLPGGVGKTAHYFLMSEILGVVPVVSLALGSVAGLGAARVAASHYSVMTKTTSAMFVAGPPVVEHIGQKVTKEELGGWQIQCRAGAIDHAVDTEAEALACARRFLSYMPASVQKVAPRLPSTDDPNRRDEALLSVIPRNRRKTYRMRPIIETLVDRGSFFEMGQHFGRSMITGLARLDGLPVAVMASDPNFYAGAWTAETCQKIVRFVDMAEIFHLPVVYLLDCPGFLIGRDAEREGTIRHGVRALAAINQTTTPWCTVIVRNAFGVAAAIQGPAGRFMTRYAWPSGWWGSLPLEGGIEAAYRAEIEGAADPIAKRVEIEQRLNRLRSPYRTAEAFGIEEIVDPRDTRSLLCDFARVAEPLRMPGRRTFAVRP